MLADCPFGADRESFLIPIERLFSDSTWRMRVVLMLVSILIVATLIFTRCASSLSTGPEGQPETNQIDPRDKAREVNQAIMDAANTQKKALEQQLQQ